MDNKEIWKRMTEHYKKVLGLLERCDDDVTLMRANLLLVADAIRETGAYVPANTALGMNVKISLIGLDDLQIRAIHRKYLEDAKKALQFQEEVGRELGYTGKAETKKTRYKPSPVVIPSSDAHSWQTFRDFSALFHGEWGVNYHAGIAIGAASLLVGMIYRIASGIFTAGSFAWEGGLLPNARTVLYAFCTGAFFTAINRFVRDTSSLPLYWGLSVVILNDLWSVFAGHAATGGMIWYFRLRELVAEALMMAGLIGAVRMSGVTRLSLMKGAVIPLVPVLLADLFFIEKGRLNMVAITVGIADRLVLALLLFYSFKRYFETGVKSTRHVEVP